MIWVCELCEEKLELSFNDGTGPTLEWNALNFSNSRGWREIQVCPTCSKIPNDQIFKELQHRIRIGKDQNYH